MTLSTQNVIVKSPDILSGTPVFAGTHVPNQPDKDAIVLDSDVRAYFPDSNTVNNALRALIALIPKKRKLTRRTSTKS
jgi:hypothetical protein